MQLELKEIKERGIRSENIVKVTAYILALITSFIHFYCGAFGVFEAYLLRTFHLYSLASLGALLSYLDRGKSKIYRWSGLFVAIALITTFVYILLEYGRIVNRELYVGEVTIADWIFAILTIALLLEVGRRTVGLVLSIVVSFFIIYNLFSHYFPHPFTTSPLPWKWFIEFQFLSTFGIFGSPIMVSATFIFLFTLFGAFLEKTKTGSLFIDLSLSAVGKMTGGPAKVAVIASSLFGNISGSAAANVYGTGTFTIPMMKKMGYEPKFAGAVEAAASTGGQIMPPIMGAAAFIMAEFIGIPYVRIMAAAIIPAMLYYIAVYYAVHAEAVKKGLKGLESVETFGAILKKSFHMFLPILAIVYLLLSGYTLYKAAFIAIILAIVVCSYNVILYGKSDIKNKLFVWSILITSGLTLFSDRLKGFGSFYIFEFLNTYQTYIFIIAATIVIILAQFRKEVLIDLKTFFDTMVLGAKNAITIAIACGLAGIIVGTFQLTGLGTRLALTISILLKDYPLVLLLMTALLAIILGMGMPTTAAYIIAAIMLAPILVRAGLVEPLIAAGIPSKEALLVIHFFIFYYATLSTLTPPVALAAYAGAAIAGARIIDVALIAMRLAFVAYLIPLYIVFEPGLLLVGSPIDIATHTISGLIGVILLSIAFSGWFFGEISIMLRGISLIAGLLALLPMYVRESILIGLTLIVLLIIIKRKRK